MGFAAVPGEYCAGSEFLPILPMTGAHGFATPSTIWTQGGGNCKAGFSTTGNGAAVVGHGGMVGAVVVLVVVVVVVEVVVVLEMVVVMVEALVVVVKYV